MLKGKVNVGCKFGTEKFAVACEVAIPENLKEALALSKGDEEFAVQMFVRGWRIWNQEQSGARDFVAGSTVQQRKAPDFPAKVQEIINKADPLAPAKRAGRPAAPITVTETPELRAAMKKGDMVAFAELMAAQGVKVNITK